MHVSLTVPEASAAQLGVGRRFAPNVWSAVLFGVSIVPGPVMLTIDRAMSSPLGDGTVALSLDCRMRIEAPPSGAATSTST